MLPLNGIADFGLPLDGQIFDSDAEPCADGGTGSPGCQLQALTGPLKREEKGRDVDGRSRLATSVSPRRSTLDRFAELGERNRVTFMLETSTPPSTTPGRPSPRDRRRAQLGGMPAYTEVKS